MVLWEDQVRSSVANEWNSGTFSELCCPAHIHIDNAIGFVVFHFGVEMFLPLHIQRLQTSKNKKDFLIRVIGSYSRN